MFQIETRLIRLAGEIADIDPEEVAIIAIVSYFGNPIVPVEVLLPELSHLLRLFDGTVRDIACSARSRMRLESVRGHP